MRVMSTAISMFKHRARFAVPLVAFAALAVPQLGAAEVRDRAGLFSSAAVKKAEAELDRIERRTHIPVVIETIEAIPGLGRDSSASEKRTAVTRLAEQRAREIGYEGVYLLISKNDHVFSPVLVQKRFDLLLPREKRQEVRDSLAREFKGGQFDEGLLKTTALLTTALLAESHTQPILVLDTGGHTAAVSKVLFTPDGKELISVSGDKTIRIWDVDSGKPLRVLRPPIGQGFLGALFAAAMSPDGRMLAVGGAGVPIRTQSPIYMVDYNSGRMSQVLEGHRGSTTSLCFSPDGKQLASASSDRTARVWNVADGRCQLVLQGHENQVNEVTFSPDGRHLATASHDKTSRIWSLGDGACEAVLRGHDKEVKCVAWRPDGKVVATGSLDGTIRQWAPDGSAFQGFGKPGAETFLSLAFAADSRELLVTGSARPSLIDVSTGRARVWYEGHTRDPALDSGALSPDGTIAATADQSGEIHLWRTFHATSVHRLAGRGKHIAAVAWGQDEKTLVWGNSLKRTGTDNDSLPLEHAFRPPELELSDAVDSNLFRARSTVGSLVLERAGKYALTVKQDGSPVSTITMSIPGDRVVSYALLLGDRVAVGADVGLYLFDARSGKRLGSFVGHTGIVFAVAPSPDGRLLLSGSNDQTVRVWVPERRRTPTLHVLRR